VERKADLMVELSRLEKYAPIMYKVQPLAERVARMQDMASIALIIERKYKAILNYLNEEISKLTNGECEMSPPTSMTVDGRVDSLQPPLPGTGPASWPYRTDQVRLPSDLARKPSVGPSGEVRQVPDTRRARWGRPPS
jgi:hypothetical protein